ncbi:hypothetical protein ZWY2020_007965 [Hordeum vulgare]|nr:hypothetical protein ZWY2020_007965 [Hordeum vulgare]
MSKYLREEERVAIFSRDGVERESVESIEYLLWAMEQTDSEKLEVRHRWWAYRSKIEHPEDDTSIRYGVSFVRLLFQVEPPECMSSRHKRRQSTGATSLPFRSPQLPCNLLGSTVAVAFRVSFALT